MGKFRTLVTDASRLGFAAQDALRGAVSLVGDEQQRAPDGKFGSGGATKPTGEVHTSRKSPAYRNQMSAYMSGAGPRPILKKPAGNKTQRFNKSVYGV